MSYRLASVACSSPAGLHRMAYYDWGDPLNPDVVLCVHGLTRNGRDFDVLAQALSSRYRVICPDVVGRGLSDWLSLPMNYVVPQYAADMVALVNQLKPQTLRWIGTSMGGLIAMTYAALLAQARVPAPNVPPARHGQSLPEPFVPISRLVLNDVGPRVEGQSIERITAYLSEPVQFESFAQAVQYVKTTAASFGPHTDAQWEMLTKYYFAQCDGRWVKHYDPAIAVAFGALTPQWAAAGEAAMWQAFAGIDAPTLVMHGEQSDLLLPDTVDAMQRVRPGVQVHTVKGVGHAPSLLQEDQIDVVRAFLQ